MRLTYRAAFAVAALAFLLVFASAGMPIPMYHLFRAEDGMGDSDFAFASVGYFVAAVSSLLLLGRLSNHLGRRWVAIGALAAAGAATALLPFVHGLGALLVVRVLQGLAAGIAPSAIGAYVMDTARHRAHHWLPAVITASTPMLGIPIGAIFAGVIIDTTTYPRIVIAVVGCITLLLVAALLALGPETMPPQPGTLSSLRPRLHVPKGSGRKLLVTGTAAIATWSLGGFFQAFAPSVAAEHLGSDDALIAAIVFSSVMILNPVGGPLGARLRTVVGVRLGLAIFVLALAGIVVSLYVGAIGPFLLSSLVVGIAQGIASTAAMRALVINLEQRDRAGLLATVYLISYAGAAVPGLVAGQLAPRLDVAPIILGYAALGVLAAAIAAFAVRDRSGT